MLLEIDDWRQVSDLQYRFNKCFPGLALEFYTQQKGNPVVLPGQTFLKFARNKHHHGVLQLKSSHTREAVENRLWEDYGLRVRVLQIGMEPPIYKAGSNAMSLQALSDEALAKIQAAATANTQEPEDAEDPYLSGRLGLES